MARQDREQPSSIIVTPGKKRTSTISAAGYNLVMYGALGTWISIITVLFVWRTSFTVAIDQTDLNTSMQVAGGVGGLSLTLLGLVHELNSGERFLKLSFAVVTVWSLVAALLAGVAVLISDTSAAISSTVTVYIAVVVLATAGTFLLGNRKGWRYHPFLPLALPVPVLFVNVSRDFIPTSAMLMTLGSLALLVVLTAVFSISVCLREAPLSEAEELLEAERQRVQREIDAQKQLTRLKDIILQLLRQERSNQLHSKGIDWDVRRGELLLSGERIHGLLAENKVFDDRASVDQALNLLSKERHEVFYRYDQGSQYYLAPTPEEIKEAERFVSSFGTVLFEKWDRQNVFHSDFIGQLASRMKYPVPVIEAYILPIALRILREEFVEHEFTQRSGSTYILYISHSRLKSLARVVRAARHALNDSLEEADRILRTWWGGVRSSPLGYPRHVVRSYGGLERDYLDSFCRVLDLMASWSGEGEDE